MATPGGEVTKHPAHGVVRHGHDDLGDRLEQPHHARAQCFSQPEPACRPERHLRRVPRVRGPVGQGDPQPGHRVAAERARGEGVPAPRLHRPDVLAGHVAAGHGRPEREAFPFLPVGRLDVQDDVGELARPAVLLDVPVHQPGHPADDGLPEGHLWPPDDDLQAAGPADLFRGHLQVQFPQAGEHRLAGLRIIPHDQRGVLLDQVRQRRRQPPGIG